MNDESNIEEEQAQQKRRDRTLAAVALIGIAAAVVWKIIGPWTGPRTDLAFIVVTVIGVLAVARLTRR
jgi:hypothetical protein